MHKKPRSAALSYSTMRRQIRKQVAADMQFVLDGTNNSDLNHVDMNFKHHDAISSHPNYIDRSIVPPERCNELTDLMTTPTESAAPEPAEEVYSDIDDYNMNLSNYSSESSNSDDNNEDIANDGCSEVNLHEQLA